MTADLSDESFTGKLKTLTKNLLNDFFEEFPETSIDKFKNAIEENDVDPQVSHNMLAHIFVLFTFYKMFLKQELVEAFADIDFAPPITSLRRLGSIQQILEKERKLESLLEKFSQPNWSIKAFKVTGKLGDSPVFQLKRYTPLQIAQQASCMQHYLHTKIEDHELLSTKYSDPIICPNICDLRNWNDNVRYLQLLSEFSSASFH